MSIPTTTRVRRAVLVLLLPLVLSLTLAVVCNGFVSSSSSSSSAPFYSSSCSSSSRLFASTGAGPGGIGESNHPPNLYAILGASPKDSDAEIKRKWQQLARKLHPDANVQNLNVNDLDKGGGGPIEPSTNYPYDLSDVNAAWGVLSDPKERRRYDRALQAQEFADTFEILLDAGIKTAIPFLQKTATGAVKLGEQSASTLKDVGMQTNTVLNDVNKRMKLKSEINDLVAQSREYDRKATSARTKMQRLQNQLDNQESRQLQSLQNPNSPLSSQEAVRLLNKFDRVDPSEIKQQSPTKQARQKQSSGGNPGFNTRKRSFLVGSTSDRADREIEFLEDLEYQYRDIKKYHQQTIQQLNQAQKQADDAIIAEQRAYQRLEQAQQDLMAAQEHNHACQQQQFNAVQTEKEAMMDYDACLSTLNQQVDKVKYVLRQKESECLQQEALSIEDKMQQLQQEEQQHLQQAAQYKNQANTLRQQEKDQFNNNK